METLKFRISELYMLLPVTLIELAEQLYLISVFCRPKLDIC